MANRNFNRFQALEKEVKSLYADIAIGAAGAPTLSKGLGIASVAKTATGEYTITLQDKYMRLMAFEAAVLTAGDTVFVVLASEDVDGAKTIQFQTRSDISTPFNLDSGSRLLVRIDLKNSSV